MKVTYPRMGNVHILVNDLLGRLDIETLTPPPTRLETISLGVRHAPELACFPLKVTLGNFIEGFEAGADAGIMVGGVGPCRFGYYAETQRRILARLGYDAPMFILEPPLAHPLKFYRTFKRVAPRKTLADLVKALRVSWRKAVYIEKIEKKALQIRCFEADRGATTRARAQAIAELEKAFLESEIERAYQVAQHIMATVPRVERTVAKIGIVGEFYILLEPFVNFDCEETLGHMGFYLEKSVYLTDWLSPSNRNEISGHPTEIVNKAAEPYLSYFVGGDGRPTIGHTVLFARDGFDGILHLMPFTCMPELIAKSILPLVSKELDIPYLSLVIDEQSGRAGIQTRLEAFADLLKARRQHNVRPAREKITWLPEHVADEPKFVPRHA